MNICTVDIVDNACQTGGNRENTGVLPVDKWKTKENGEGAKWQNGFMNWKWQGSDGLCR